MQGHSCWPCPCAGLGLRLRQLSCGDQSPVGSWRMCMWRLSTWQSTWENCAAQSESQFYTNSTKIRLKLSLFTLKCYKSSPLHCTPFLQFMVLEDPSTPAGRKSWKCLLCGWILTAAVMDVRVLALCPHAVISMLMRQAKWHIIQPDTTLELVHLHQTRKIKQWYDTPLRLVVHYCFSRLLKAGLSWNGRNSSLKKKPPADLPS